MQRFRFLLLQSIHRCFSNGATLLWKDVIPRGGQAANNSGMVTLLLLLPEQGRLAHCFHGGALSAETGMAGWGSWKMRGPAQ